MLEILSSTYFKYLAVPLITTFLVIFIKIVSRNDRFTLFKKEDFAFGLNMGVTAVLILLGNCVNVAQKGLTDNNITQLANETLLKSSWIILILVFGLWGMSTIVRRLGWKYDDELKIFWGIVVPDIFGLIVLIYVVSLIGF
jgi:hypothetical protein